MCSLDNHPPSLPLWPYNKDEDQINRRYKFTNYQNSLNFVISISQIAEENNHHPDITFGWGYAHVSLQTHETQTVEKLDYAMAHQFDEIYNNNDSPTGKEDLCPM